jgi:proton-dependent oligopeptide transporter, POT family
MTTAKEKMPKGVYYIIGNEAAERFSFYGMKAILMIFMTKYILDSQGQEAFFTGPQASEWYHYFVAAVYFFPLFGALLADLFLGKYKTIIGLSIVYCLGHLVLALMEAPFILSIAEPRTLLAIGLGFIAIGSGGIKPCVSAHVGDQFDSSKQHLIDKVFSYFYLAINFGSFFSYLIIPFTLEHYGPSVAFGIPGILMFIATLIFYMGRHEFISMPPAGATFLKDLLSRDGIIALLKLSLLYSVISVFWSLYDQTGSSWLLQVDKLDRIVNLGFTSFTLLPAQVQAINPILVLLYIPLFTLFIYPFFGRYVKITPLRKISTGFFLTALSFAVVAMTEQWIQNGSTPSMLWQVLAFVLITAAEILISITALEFSYTQAPNSMKSFVMALFMFSISLGNLITANVNGLIEKDKALGYNILSGANYFWFFTFLVLAAGIIFIIIAHFYKEKTYLQDHNLAEAT